MYILWLSACVNIVYVLCVLFSHVYNNVETPQFIADCGIVQIVLVRVILVAALSACPVSVFPRWTLPLWAATAATAAATACDAAMYACINKQSVCMCA